MESTTRFSLDQHIATWRSELASSGILSREDLDELESHLLDELEQLSSCPLTEKEGFMVAKDRIGTHAELSRPYARSKSLWSLFKARSPIYLQAVLVLMIISLTNRIVEFATILTVGFLKLPMTWGSYLYSGLLVVLLSAIFLWLRFVSRKLRKQRKRISFTGHLTIVTLIISVLTAFLGVQFVGGPIELELLSVFMIRQYIWIAGFMVVFITSIVYSIREVKSHKPKTV